jgi:Na+/H+ antiporter NhaD/arsenite permease-like protein
MEFDLPQLASVLIFAITFYFILTERIHRAVIAFVGASAMVVTGIFMGFYNAEQAIESVDFNTIGLLFGMMMLVALMEETGVFQFLGIYVARKTKGNPWLLMIALGLLTAFLSMILDNVTTIVLITPITIIIARLIGISPLPLLMGEAILSNIGGVGTLVGDPPNIMIGSPLAAGFSFNTFLVYALPVALISLLVVLVIFRFLFRKDLAQEPRGIERLMAMDPKEAVKDVKKLKKLLAVFGMVIALFFLHNVFHIEPSTVALLGAAIGLLVVRAKEDPHHIIQKTELSVLLFFASLFIIVGGMEHTHVLAKIGELITGSAESNLLLTAIIILWVSAVMSAIVDNIPFTVAMIPIIAYLGAEGVAVDLLWWALVFGVGFGGNGTPIGSSAGVIVMSKSEETDTPITFKSWLRSGLIATFASLCVATVAIYIFYTFELVAIV